MAIVELVMPKMGESIMEATILRWHKKPGDQVKSDETILEIATDKVDSEVPSIADGEITEILYAENDVVPVGAVIARISTKVEAAASAPATAPEAPVQQQQQAEVEVVKPQVEVHEPQFTTAAGPRFYSPLVLTIAQQEGIGFAELEKIPGTGNEGRVTKKDILNYVESKAKGFVPTATPMPAKAAEAPVAQEQPKAQPQVQPAPQPVAAQAQPQAPQVQVQPQTAASSNGQAATYSGAVEIIEMDRMRKLIADHMMKSVQTNAHVTSFAEADVTNIVRWRDQEKKIFEKREGEKITFTPLFIEALIKCLKKYPLLNSSLEGDRIIVKKDINVGMAAALPTGNLIVPVIRNADQLNLVGLTKQVNLLANAARNNKLRPEDTQNGTITLTNVGNFGSLAGTPIINMPQVAILAVGTIKKRPVVIETEHGDTIAIRHMMYLSMSYDHRIIDGALGSTFLSAVVHELEHFDVHREY
ncbi:dihydrolipoamide acetyltransferase family protein [Chitinophaga sancti]|uniref:Dihydrolipoamide acetyltransferase component of pyruvate dehydrogenase complex n=1 Tax=Chitinophaga sancti TaxID=1004 RepID=A0A1K1QTS2_9BACT|nr:dihydrolipoamide acetyltransferase family protein [Chitinophaga sancti]WQD61930.1 dihydrolipoamide acetyltransferase family protein [Chitinophaga sancti]WQG92501.1 dihydrolipoamide acetyltransferase family protein [Chitinophaga sancti]SFW63272.1 2-oxoglutarate dehydrogenase E2 component (dihydrolipoamide succinyltransferase) [Chitinophaga sancti]